MFIHDISLQNYIVLIKSDTLNFFIDEIGDLHARFCAAICSKFTALKAASWLTSLECDSLHFLHLPHYERNGLVQTFCKFTLNQYFWTLLLICNCRVIWHITVSTKTKMGSQWFLSLNIMTIFFENNHHNCISTVFRVIQNTMFPKKRELILRL